MAAAFGCDPVVAGQVGQALGEIHADMNSLGSLFDTSDGATGSPRVESALDAFFADSSDNRSRMGKLLERASGLLRGLAEGTTSVDTGLAGALEMPAEPVSPPQSQSRPTTGATAR